MRVSTLLASMFLLPTILLPHTVAQQPTSGPKAQAREETVADVVTAMGRKISGQPLLEDLDQFRSLLKREWILSNLNGADFDAAIDAIAQDAPTGMSIAELTFRLQRVLAMGGDGHAGIAQFVNAMLSIRGDFPNFLIDVSGGGYTSYLVEHAAGGSVNPKFEHKFVALREGYPHLLAIGGKPISEWVRAAKPYIPRGTAQSMRWRAMFILQYLPFLRHELHLPDAPTIHVRLASADRKSEIEFDAPTNKNPRFHLVVPKPDSRILDGNIGYLWFSDCFGGGTETAVRGMPKLRDTRGLILDLRDNEGGNGFETLQIIAAYLLPLDRPRRAIGEMVHWRGERRYITTAEVDANSKGLSAEARRIVAAFQEGDKRAWQPPKGRETESRTNLLARAEAEPNLYPYNHERFPKTYHYTAPVVVLLNERCFSGAELFLAGIREVGGVTLVGSAATAGGGGSPEFFRLRHSGLDVELSHNVFVRADGTLIDGKGIAPDVVVEPDSDYYLGVRDRMLEKAIEILKGKAQARR